VILVHGYEKYSAESSKHAPRHFHESELMMKGLALSPSSQTHSAQNPLPVLAV